MLKISKKILVILLLSIIFISNASNIINATYIGGDAYIEKKGEADYHLKYYNDEKGMYTYRTCDILGYTKDGKWHPAYCLNRGKNGPGKIGSYTVYINSFINNNKVWRAVKNGYPYKTAGQMGLSSDYDAYAVTLDAIYCLIGQADVNIYQADEGDQEGQAMLSALHNLVKIGEGGSETFNDNLQITKVQDLTEDGNYYSIIYKVSSNSEVSSYNIKSVSGLENGDLITDVNGNIKTSFTSGENFKIKLSKLDSNRNINIEIQADLKCYPMYKGDSVIAGSQNYLLTTDNTENVTKTANINLKLDTGKLKIEKIDDETKKGIKDVTFELYNSKKELVQTKTTDANGEILFESLFSGEYVLKETKTNENYILKENTEFNVHIDYNETSLVQIENEHKKGDLTIYKVDKEDNKLTLGNVEFELYSEELGKVVGTYNTDVDGKIEIKNLRTGNYLLKETKTNQWYNLAKDTNVEIKWNELTETTVEDELKKGGLRVIKVDKDNNEIKLPNVEFEVLDTTDNVLETIKTNENGEAYTKEYVIRDYQELRLRETKTDELYELNNEIIEVPLEANKVKDVIVENQKIRGNIQIIKTTEDKSEITGLEKGAPLEGVIFEIYSSNGNLVDTVTTNKEGIATTKDLEKGTYKVKETKTNEWYILDENYYTVEITKNKEMVSLNIKNKPKKPDAEIEKTGPDKAQANEEIEYKINIKNTGNVPLDNFTFEDQIPTDYIRLTKMNLGTYNQDGSYNLYYKTNFTEDYVLFLEGLDTKKSEEIDFSKELSSNEYITSIKIDFGTVNAGFSSDQEMSLFAKVNSDVKRDDVFQNTAILTGKYNGIDVIKDSTWKTKVYEILPLTGM